MIRRLVDTLAQVGKATEVLTGPDGTTLLVLPYGGRVLGLYAAGREENFLWTHPSLASVESASAFYQSAEWHNSGGDRTWLAPEVDLFFPHFPKLDTYSQPRQFDPGNYELVRGDGTVTLANRFSIQLVRSKRTVDLEITKRLAPAPSPLRYLNLSSQLHYAGYTLRTRLEFSHGHAAREAQVGLWTLVQLPHGGELLIPTFSKATPQIYMGHINACDLIVAENLIRYKLRASGEHKFGVQAPALTGRAGYLRSSGSDFSLVVRSFPVNPSGEYIDVPWTEPDSVGFAVEACNINSKLGTFAELEYHAPAIGGQSGDSYCEDESQLWAFCGSEEAIMAAARILISSQL